MKPLSIFIAKSKDGSNHMTGKGQIISKNSYLGTFSSKGFIKFQFLTAHMDCKKYIEILENSKFDTDISNSNGILLLLDSESKHKSEI